ncbi:MAG: FAD-dependent oxidoreductase [Desulfarculales bacterium]|jgi:nitrite reductase (NADH) large subunit|nr:FAD-dependent oxidoreductase [Desulfarculales bacterium]
MKRYVIIGNGAAGASAAEQIRLLDNEGSITMFTRESHPFYYRPRLPEYLAGEISLDKFTMHSPDKYKQWRVDLRLEDSIVSIDPKAGRVVSAKSGPLDYDALLLACGASANIPSLPGTDKKGVFALRSLEDANAIKAAAARSGQAVLVGGGLMGLEAGHALIKLGLRVQVAEFFGRLLPRQMDAAGAGLLQALLEKMGFVFHLNVRVREISGADCAQGLLLENGTCLPGGLVIFSAGIRPNLELAIDLQTDKAIKVNEYMRTSQPGVWAAGDAAEYQGQPGGIWPTAMAQGKAAGADMAGKPFPYLPKPPSASLKVAGINLTSAGDIDPEDKLTAKRLIRGDNYRKIILRDDVIKGFIFLGAAEGVRQCAEAMNQGKKLGSLTDELDREDFDFKRLSL